MILIVDFLLIAAGFALLIKSADFLVDGASALAVKFSVSQIVIGLTIVSFGTSAPELIVNVIASLGGNSDITLGNVIGSNIINTLLILGVAGLIYPIKTVKNTVWREIPYSLLAAALLILACNDLFLDGTANILSRSEGLIFLLFFLIFIVYSFAIARVESVDVPEIRVLSNLKIIVFILIGIAGLFYGGKLVVNYAINIARELHISEKMIGLTIVAIGTSLPELVTTAVAAYRKRSDIAIGNVVGSNIFNIFFVLAVSVIIRPIPFTEVLNLDLLVLLGASLFLFLLMFSGKKRTIDRWESVLLVFVYILYMGYIINRG